MPRIGSIVWNTSDNSRAAEFWSKALGYEQDDNPDFLDDKSSGGVRLHLDQTDRTHLDSGDHGGFAGQILSHVAPRAGT